MPKKRAGTRNAPGLGSVYWSERQRRWVGAITIGRDEETGKQLRKIIVGPRGDASNDARLGLHDRLGVLARVVRQRPRRTARAVTLAQYLDAQIRDRTDLSEAARVTYTWAIEHHINPAIGQVKLNGLTRDRIKAFYAGIKLSKASEAKIRQVLHGGFKMLLAPEIP